MKKIMAMILMIIVVMMLVSGCQKQPANAPASNANNIQAPATQQVASPNTATKDTTTSTQASATPPAPAVASQVKELKLEVYSFGFKVINNVQINKGDRVKITVTSSSGTHGLALPDFNVNISPISQGETKSAEFVADKSGTFKYFCNVPCGTGHKSMVGEIIVS